MVVYKRTEVQNHNSKESSWVIINNKVYDVTPFHGEHPGGEDILIENSGRDATTAFMSVGHSSDAQELMKKYEIGTTKEIVPEKRMSTLKMTDTKEERNMAFAFLMSLIIAFIFTVLYTTYF